MTGDKILMLQKDKQLKRMLYCLQTIRKEIVKTDKILTELDIAEKKLETDYNRVNLKRVETVKAKLEKRIVIENSICNSLASEYKELERIQNKKLC